MKHSPRPHPPTNPPGPVWAPPWTAPSSVGSGALQSLKQNYFLTIKILIKSKLSVSFFFHWISEFQYFNWSSFQQNLDKKLLVHVLYVLLVFLAYKLCVDKQHNIWFFPISWICKIHLLTTVWFYKPFLATERHMRYE